MGLLYPKTEQSQADHTADILRSVLREFNEWHGTLWSFKVGFNETAFKEAGDLFEKIAASNFPPKPGPFKRLAAYSVLVSEFDIYSFEPTRKYESEHNINTIWTPRIIVWTLPQITPALQFESGTKLDDRDIIGRAHFQLDFISVLRNMRHGVFLAKSNGSYQLDEGNVLERISLLSLTLEAAYYAAAPAHLKQDCPIKPEADQCIELASKDGVFLDDLMFNDSGFLERSLDLGLD